MGLSLDRPDRPSSRKRLGELLAEASLIRPDDLHRALEEQRRSGRRLGEVLTLARLISEQDLAAHLGRQLGYPTITLETTQPDPDALALLPEAVARGAQAAPIALEGRVLTVAMSDPQNAEALKDLSFVTGCVIRPVVAPAGKIAEWLDQTYRQQRSLRDLLSESVGEFAPESVGDVPEDAPSAAVVDEADRLEAPVVRLANLILSRAVRDRASDIHVEPVRDALVVRFRVDGLLREEMRLPKWIHPPLISRYKILARLDIAERRRPQDGAVRMKAGSSEVDLRLSTLPTQHGEKAVLRILDPSSAVHQMANVGLSAERRRQLERLLKRKKGILLVTGPTGSGKTSTLYTILNVIKSGATNLVTVEDPVEYQIDGVNQVQVHPDIGLNFASVLRAVLRQDPNIILIGEIRDGETAEIAFRAAMTGHLVLSTLHTNDTVGTIGRLVDLGVPRYLVASLVVGIVAQRLVRRLCPECRVPEDSAAQSGSAHEGFAGVAAPFRAGECRACRSTGYRGRTALFEILDMPPGVRDLVASGASEADLREAASRAGMTTLFEDGIEKIREGITTPEEVARIADWEGWDVPFCPGCAKPIHPEYRVCPRCGRPATDRCASCGRMLQGEWALCPFCATRREGHA